MKKNNIILIFALLTLSHWAIASGCVPRYEWLTLREYNTHTVFVGKLLSAVDVPDGLTVALKYQVVTNYRNTPVGDTITVYCSMCEWSAEEYQQKAIGLEDMIYATYDSGSYGLACPPFLRRVSVKTYQERLQNPDILPYQAQICNNIIHSWALIDEVKQRGNKTIKSYHPNGVLEAKGKLKNSMPDGKWEYYDENGRLLEVVNYKEGVRWGESEGYYYENDTLRNNSFVNYENNRIVNYRSFDNISGESYSASNNYIFMRYGNNYVRDSLETTELYFDKYKRKYKKIETKYDVKQKRHQIVFIECYHQNGVLSEKGIRTYSKKYDLYVKTGMWMYYDTNEKVIRTEMYDENGDLQK